MVTPSSRSKSKTSNTNRFDRIDIWRNEVASSQIYCVCSAPAMQSDTAGARESHGSFFPGVPSTAVSSTFTELYKGSTKPLAHPWYGELKQRREGLLSKASARLGSPRQPPERDGSACSICASPTDGVAYQSLGGDGCGFILRKKDSSRSISSSIKCLEEGGRTKMGRPSLLKAVSQVFRRTKKLDLPRSSSDSSPPPPPPPQQQQQQQMIGDADMLPPSGPPRVITMVGPTTVMRREGSGTEMYHSLRREKRMTVDGTGDHDEEIDSFSDDDGKKPRIGIEETAARLHRAQKLLYSY